MSFKHFFVYSQAEKKKHYFTLLTKLLILNIHISYGNLTENQE